MTFPPFFRIPLQASSLSNNFKIEAPSRASRGNSNVLQSLQASSFFYNSLQFFRNVQTTSGFSKASGERMRRSFLRRNERGREAELKDEVSIDLYEFQRCRAGKTIKIYPTNLQQHPINLHIKDPDKLEKAI